MKDEKPTAVNLFCGSGALTLGLKRAGFKVVAGVELSHEISKTYKANHQDVKLLIKDVRETTGKEIFELTGLEEIDLVAGCPPCQGFCQLTEKYKRKDSRNDLVLEMGRLIAEIKPKIVMMENVPGILTKGKTILDEFLAKLKELDYYTNMNVLQMADYGVPQSRRRFVLLAGKGFEVPLPKPTYSREENIKNGLKSWLNLSDIIKKMSKPVKFSYALQNGGPEKFKWHIVRDLKKISIQRLKVLKEGDGRIALPKRLRPKCHKNRKKGFNNVYGRLSWDKVSSTITSGCTTPAMGRFGHPEELRTISIREAALIQTFPFNYKFNTKFMETASKLVGNALPYKFAHKAAKACLNALKENS